MKKKKFSKKCVTAMLVSVFVFTIVMIILYDRHEAVPAQLIIAFFSFMAAEGGAMAWIKNVDTKHEKKKIKKKEEEKTDEEMALTDKADRIGFV